MKVLSTDKFTDTLPGPWVKLVTGTYTAQESLQFAVGIPIVVQEEATTADRAVTGTH